MGNLPTRDPCREIPHVDTVLRYLSWGWLAWHSSQASQPQWAEMRESLGLPSSQPSGLAGLTRQVRSTRSMSMFPCSEHGARVKGPLGALYVSALHGTDRYSRRMRLCGPCLASVLSGVGGEWIPADSSDAGVDLPMCSACSKPVQASDDSWAVFATAYPPGSNRDDYFGQLHAACATGFVDGLGLKAA